MFELVLLNVFNGLVVGAFYVLMALGLSLILNVAGVINFAHGGFLAVGGYLAFTITPVVGFWGALLIAPLLTALVGIIVEQTIIKTVYGRDPLYSFLLTFGLAFIFEDVTRAIWGAQGLPSTVPVMLQQPVSASLFFITWYRAFMVAVAAVAIIGLFALLRYSRLGVRIRAGMFDVETASSLGVNIRVLRLATFAMGIYLAGLAGVLAGGMLGLEPTMGSAVLMPAFVAIIVGGAGSLLGTMLGRLLIGVASGLTTLFWPAASEAMIYGIMLAVLVFRPRGLLGHEGVLS